MKWVLLLVLDEKTGAENKKQPAQGYTVTLPIESATHWFLSEFKLPESRFPTSHL